MNLSTSQVRVQVHPASSPTSTRLAAAAAGGRWPRCRFAIHFAALCDCRGGAISFGNRYSSRIHVAAAGDPYSNPALYTNDDAFSLATYWDERYRREGGAPFEWYRDYGSLEPVLSRHLDKAQRVLQVGVGSSRIQFHMHHDGYLDVLSVDYAPACIEQLSALHDGLPGLSYEVADCRTMPQYGDGAFGGGVLDKGTLDALLCGDSEEVDAAAMLAECRRVLQYGASYVCVTHAPPRSRLRYLARPELGWDICFYEVGQQGWREGPVAVPTVTAEHGASGGLADAALAAYPKQRYSHFVYVCTKR